MWLAGDVGLSLLWKDTVLTFFGPQLIGLTGYSSEKTYKLEILKEEHTPEGFESLSSRIWNDQESREQCFEVCSTLQCEPRHFFEGSYEHES